MSFATEQLAHIERTAEKARARHDAATARIPAAWREPRPAGDLIDVTGPEELAILVEVDASARCLTQTLVGVARWRATVAAEEAQP